MEAAFEAALKKLHEFIGSPEFAAEIQVAKDEFFRRVMAPLPGEAIYELRLASFVEWFIFDRQLPAVSRAPVEEYLRRHAEEFTAEEVEVWRGFTRSVHSVFEVTRRAGDADLRDLYTGRKYREVKRVPVTLGKGDLAELRLVPVGGAWLGADALCFHPYLARKQILKILKAARKTGEPIDETLEMLMAMNTRFEHYPKTAKKTAYERKTVARLPRT